MKNKSKQPYFIIWKLGYTCVIFCSCCALKLSKKIEQPYFIFSLQNFTKELLHSEINIYNYVRTDRPTLIIEKLRSELKVDKQKVEQPYLYCLEMSDKSSWEFLGVFFQGLVNRLKLGIDTFYF